MNAEIDDTTIVLFRPIGKRELDLIQQSGYTKFPKRLSHQPLFYPVLTQEYAEKIARDWNTKDERSEYSGYVTRFRVKRSFIDKYPIQIVGSAHIHRELWIPADELDEFNQALVGLIEIVSEYHSEPR